LAKAKESLQLRKLPLPPDDGTEPGSGFQVERYEVGLRPDLNTTAISGRETIVAGDQPRTINRALLLETQLPADWAEQESLLGLCA
jgi:hypothetical protein